MLLYMQGTRPNKGRCWWTKKGMSACEQRQVMMGGEAAQASPGCVCVCARACVRACVCARACVCVRARAPRVRAMSQQSVSDLHLSKAPTKPCIGSSTACTSWPISAMMTVMSGSCSPYGMSRLLAPVLPLWGFGSGGACTVCSPALSCAPGMHAPVPCTLKAGNASPLVSRQCLALCKPAALRTL